jgi:hypothetical protein
MIEGKRSRKGGRESTRVGVVRYAVFVGDVERSTTRNEHDNEDD